ncbi:MAG TPA: hypothetical protein VFP54_06030 [Acidimicrobiales bacterium]|nr:hypothetical protein [Acidimicrobiales bacterium]
MLARILFFVALVGAMAVDAAPAAASAHGAAPPAELVYAAPGGAGSQTGCLNAPCGNQQVFLAVTDGNKTGATGTTQLTQTAANAFGPVLSPDGAYVAYRDYGTTAAGAPAPTLALASTDGQTQRVLDATGGGQGPTIVNPPSWSPDGRYIAYDVLAPGSPVAPSPGMQVHMVSPDGSGQQVLANGADPAWSPTDTGIAFVGADGIDFIRPGQAQQSLYPYSAWDAQDAYAADCPASQGDQVSNSFSNLAWSPDGRMLAFTAAAGCSNPDSDFSKGDVWLAGVGPDGANPHRILATNSPAAWSPDASSLAIGDFGGIDVVSPDGSNEHKIRTGDMYGDLLPSWSPTQQKFQFYECERTGTDAQGNVVSSDVLTTVNTDGSSRSPSPT